MRILFTTTSGIGHLHPLVPLAHAASTSGHQARLAAPESLAPQLAERRLAHLELPDYGPDHLAHVEEVMRQLGPPGPGAEVSMFREVFGWAKTASTLDAMRRAVGTWRPDLVVHEAAELSGALAAEEADVPHVTVAIGLRETLAAFLPHAAEGAAELATSIGLPADPEARRILDVPYATLVPPGLDGRGAPMPSTVVRYRLTDIHGGDPTPLRRGTGPLVWIALGTETWRIPGMMERVGPLMRAAAEKLPRVRFLLTTGSNDATVPVMPDNVEVASYVPQEAVLEACDVVLGHGGFNTTVAALSRGIPLVVVPLFATDQFENAARLAAVGAGVALDAPSPDDVAHAVERALTDPSLAAAAGSLAEEMAALTAPGEAVEQLLTAATRHQPHPAPGSTT